MMGIKNAEFSADFKNEKCTYVKCTYKVIPKQLAIFGESPNLACIFGRPFYMCILHFLKSAENSALFDTHKGGGG
jgi:hypothetical protein